MKTLAILAILLLPVGLFAQESKATHQSFEEFCRNKALSIMEVSSAKLDGLEIEGEVVLDASGALTNFEEYNIQPAEDRTLYYTISDSDKLLAVMSLFRLRLLYETQKNQAQ